MLAMTDEEYTTGRWKGLVKYECAKCPFSTVDGEEVILEHLRQHHGPPPRKVVELPLVDRFGNPLTKVVEEEGIGREVLRYALDASRPRPAQKDPEKE